MTYKKKLIEVALPLEAINAESAREKSIRHGHPSTLHLWWARRPLATARAVIWSSLVDDPSSHPDLFPTEELQRKERERLFGILSRLVVWENSNDPAVLAEAKVEIMRSTGGNPPALLDPFAGGGAIPLEAQRLGLEAHAQDLNPVAVMINKAMIEIPALFSDHSPVNQDNRDQLSNSSWVGASGLAQDVLFYGKMLKQKAYDTIGQYYPKIDVVEGGNKKKLTVIAWLWARTMKCPNPACGSIMPLVSSFVISRRRGKGKVVWVKPSISGNDISFSVFSGDKLPDDYIEPKRGRGARFVCPTCGFVTEDSYVKSIASQGLVGQKMMAIVADGGNEGRLYFAPSSEHINASIINMDYEMPRGSMPNNPRWFSPPAFGMKDYKDLFTRRQGLALTTFSDLLQEVRKSIEKDAENAGLYQDHIALCNGGHGARAYSEAIIVYLSFIIDQMANHSSVLCGWHVNNEQLMNTFGRQALPMVWDFAETNIFSNSTGSFDNLLERLVKGLSNIKYNNKIGKAVQMPAQIDNGMRNIMISTDPPYYDNIGYADLSDYFYVWMRRSLKDIYPDIFKTVMVPKAEELVATPYHFDGDSKRAKEFFENGMLDVCRKLYAYSLDSIPITIYYAFKQSDTDEDDNTASSGWETMLSAIIQAGLSITGTWPMRTEQTAALKSNINALASSIVLVCRKRNSNAGAITRRDFMNAIHREMRPALKALQSANIAPVDLAQSAIGPGIGVFSRYDHVVEADGSPMSVRSALQIINQELDLFYNEQEGELDAKSRFCVDIFSQFAFNAMKFGEADVLARAKNTSVQALVDEGVMEAAKGSVQLKTRDEIPEKIDSNEDCCWKITQQLARAFERGGVKECAAAVVNLKGYIAENAKALAYRLYTICERKNWAAEGYAYNNLIVAWPDIQNEAARLQTEAPVQMSMLDQL